MLNSWNLRRKTNPASEIGRELKVSELKPDTIVWLQKEGNPATVTMWVIDIGAVYVKFWAGVTRTYFMAIRRGPGLDEIGDDTHAPMKIFEFLGKP